MLFQRTIAKSVEVTGIGLHSGRRVKLNLHPAPVDYGIRERKPFVARMLFHDNSEVYEGACRDISVGGMQILVSDFPGEVGEEIALNVHPENGEYCFVAAGKIVRFLDGKQGFSFRFTELSDDAKKVIENYVDHHG